MIIVPYYICVIPFDFVYESCPCYFFTRSCLPFTHKKEWVMWRTVNAYI